MKRQYYEIRLRNHLGSNWSEWFDGLDVRQQENGETVLCGQIVDQAALHGVLARIRDLNLTLISVNQLDQEEVPS